MAAMAKGLVYLEITTRADLRENTDRTRTDADIYVRNGSYYRGLLQKHLVIIGAGLYWPKDRPAPFYELEIGGAK
jgi:hypothetical protein